MLKKVTHRAHRLDNCMSFCGVRIGWEAIIGIIPGIGDFAGSLLALMVLHTCDQANIPPALRSRMMFNIVLDFFIGLVPFLGDVADTFYRCNTRNASLLYGHLRERGAARIKKGTQPRDSSRNGRDQSQNRNGQKSRDQSQKRQPQANPANPQPSALEPGPVTSNMSTVPGQSSAMVPAQESRFVSPNDIEIPPSAKTKKSGGDHWLSRLTGSRGPKQEPVRDVEHDAHEMGQI